MNTKWSYVFIFHYLSLLKLLQSWVKKVLSRKVATEVLNQKFFQGKPFKGFQIKSKIIEIQWTNMNYACYLITFLMISKMPGRSAEYFTTLMSTSIEWLCLLLLTSITWYYWVCCSYKFEFVLLQLTSTIPSYCPCLMFKFLCHIQTWL